MSLQWEFGRLGFLDPVTTPIWITDTAREPKAVTNDVRKEMKEGVQKPTTKSHNMATLRENNKTTPTSIKS